ncbi:MAG: peptidoglycan DD-metalloendopeptidase family protein [Burkholderiaceae bacterium]
MKITRFSIVLAAIALMAACSTPRRPAPVVERAGASESSRAAAAETKGMYTVRKGDTLYRIALEFGQNYRDLVAWNNLANPNDIKVGQVLRVAPLEAGTPNGVQVASIPPSGVEVKSIGNASSASSSASSSSSAATGPASSGAMTKTGPRGEKRPYSETALAELQKPDTEGGAAPTAPPAPPPIAKVAPPAQEKPAPAPIGDDDALAWIWPAEGRIATAFDDSKKGIDIAGRSGQPVVAAAAGKVMYAGSGIRGYGNLVIIKHTNNLLSAYAHNKTILVKEGQTVARGQKIAEMGNSDTDSVKLHFEIRQQGKPVDPMRFLPGR